MKSNEELEMLLRESEKEEIEVEKVSAISNITSDTMDQDMIESLLLSGSSDNSNSSSDDFMDQDMIEALLASADERDAKAAEEKQTDDNIPMDQDMIEALLSGEKVEVTEESGVSNSVDQDMLDALLTEENKDTEVLEDESASMLAQLMTEIQDEPVEVIEDSFDEETAMSEESIEALLSAAKNSANDVEEELLDIQLPDESEMSEIEELLNMSDNGEVLDENMALLQMLEEADSFPAKMEEEREVDMSELDAILSLDQSPAEEKEKKEKKKREKKEKKSGGMKNFFDKILSALVEEVPEEEGTDANAINLSDENKEVLKQLDQEEEKKIKAKEKKEKKEKKQQAKKAKKEAKEAKAKEKKEKAPKPKKEKVAVLDIESLIPEKKLPKKKVIVTFVFAFSVLAAILLVEFLFPPVLSVSRARSAYDKGEYLQAYKEYYGENLSEEDEKRFQGATAILRMQSNLDGYNSYKKIGDEVTAIHSLLEAVHVRDDVFAKAQEFDVLSKVSEIYNQILNILNGEYQLTEEDAMQLVQEKSDVTYTQKLQFLAEGKVYVEETVESVNQENLLPEEEELFLNAD